MIELIEYLESEPSVALGLAAILIPFIAWLIYKFLEFKQDRLARAAEIISGVSACIIGFASLFVIS